LSRRLANDVDIAESESAVDPKELGFLEEDAGE
jgi:hypothetical protein